MMLPFVTEIGVAVAPASATEPKYIAVQLFGRPDSTKYTFKITNKSAAMSPTRSRKRPTP